MDLKEAKSVAEAFNVLRDGAVRNHPGLLGLIAESLNKTISGAHWKVGADGNLSAVDYDEPGLFVQYVDPSTGALAQGSLPGHLDEVRVFVPGTADRAELKVTVGRGGITVAYLDETREYGSPYVELSETRGVRFDELVLPRLAAKSRRRRR